MANISFYVKFGFQTIAEEPMLNTPNWFVRRAPERRTSAGSSSGVGHVH
jgi:hypothetical protein